MTTEIWRDFDPNLAIPEGLKNARELSDRAILDILDLDGDIDFQTDTFIDEESELDEDYVGEELGVPGSFTIVKQTIKTAPDGKQVVDVIIEVEEVESASSYEVRIAK